MHHQKTKMLGHLQKTQGPTRSLGDIEQFRLKPAVSNQPSVPLANGEAHMGRFRPIGQVREFLPENNQGLRRNRNQTHSLRDTLQRTNPKTGKYIFTENISGISQKQSPLYPIERSKLATSNMPQNVSYFRDNSKMALTAASRGPRHVKKPSRLRPIRSRASMSDPGGLQTSSTPYGETPCFQTPEPMTLRPLPLPSSDIFGGPAVPYLNFSDVDRHYSPRDTSDFLSARDANAITTTGVRLLPSVDLGSSFSPKPSSLGFKSSKEPQKPRPSLHPDPSSPKPHEYINRLPYSPGPAMTHPSAHRRYPVAPENTMNIAQLNQKQGKRNTQVNYVLLGQSIQDDRSKQHLEVLRKAYPMYDWTVEQKEKASAMFLNPHTPLPPVKENRKTKHKDSKVATQGPSAAGNVKHHILDITESSEAQRPASTVKTLSQSKQQAKLSAKPPAPKAEKKQEDVLRDKDGFPIISSKKIVTEEQAAFQKHLDNIKAAIAKTQQTPSALGEKQSVQNVTQVTDKTPHSHQPHVSTASVVDLPQSISAPHSTPHGTPRLSSPVSNDPDAGLTPVAQFSHKPLVGTLIVLQPSHGMQHDTEVKKPVPTDKEASENHTEPPKLSGGTEKPESTEISESVPGNVDNTSELSVDTNKIQNQPQESEVPHTSPGRITPSVEMTTESKIPQENSSLVTDVVGPSDSTKEAVSENPPPATADPTAVNPKLQQMPEDRESRATTRREAATESRLSLPIVTPISRSFSHSTQSSFLGAPSEAWAGQLERPPPQTPVPDFSPAEDQKAANIDVVIDPKKPGEPGKLEAPGDPAGAEKPEGPAEPERPKQVQGPGEPEGSGEPGEPEGPVELGKPDDPEKLEGLEEPREPVGIEKPEGPGES